MEDRKEDLLNVLRGMLEVTDQFGFNFVIKEGRIVVLSKETGEEFEDIESLFLEAVGVVPKGFYIL